MGRSIIRTAGLTKRYGDVTAVKGLDLVIQEGEVFGLLGPNGAGKTTTTLMLLGLTEPTEGSAVIDGHDCTRDSIAVKKIVGYLPDSIGFYPDLTGRENLHFTGDLNGLEQSVCKERAEQLLNRVGLSDAADRKTGTYSRGMKQRLGIADVLMKDPKVIIMDEPTLGIDPEGMRQLLELIREMSKKEHRTILISSHQLYQVQQVCDRMGLFVEGRLAACGTLEELAEQTREGAPVLTEIKVEPADEGFVRLIKELEGVYSVGREGSRLIVGSDRDVGNALAQAALNCGLKLVSLRPCGNDLADIYQRYFEKAGHEDGNRDGSKIKRFISRNR